MDKKYSILVIGAGLSGLTTAYTLAKNGHHVTVLYKAMSGIVSEVPGAIWVLPMPSTSWKDKQTENQLKKWAMCTYKRLADIAGSNEPSGVHVENIYCVFGTKILASPINSAYMNAMNTVPGFRHSHHILQEKGINGPGLADCFTYNCPIVDPDVYLKWLTKKCQSLGVRFQQGTVTDLFKERVESLKREFAVDLVVNCTGLASRELVGDKDSYPITGAAIVCERNDKSLPDFVIDCITHWHDDEFKTKGHVVLAPRGLSQNKYWIGTIYSELPPSTLHINHPVIQRMLSECYTVYPPLKGLMAGQRLTLKVGSRPARKGSPRVERDESCQSMIHNYGHGGYGCILSWGCAEEVLRIIQNRNSSKMPAKL